MKNNIAMMLLIGLMSGLAADEIKIGEKMISFGEGKMRQAARIEYNDHKANVAIINEYIQVLPRKATFDQILFHNPQRERWIITSGKIALADFKSYPEIEYLGLSGMYSIDFTGLAGFKQLGYLDASRAELKNFNSAGSASIRILSMTGCRIPDGDTFEFGPDWPKLEQLIFGLNKDAAINYDSFKNLPALKRLFLFAWSLESIDFLKGHQLDSFMIQGAKLTDIAILEGMPLRQLLLGSSQVTDLSALKKLNRIEELDVNTRTYDDYFPIEWISSMPLRRLTWRNGKISNADAEKLAAMPITQLRLHAFICTDLAKVLSMPLEALALHRIYTDTEPLTVLKNNKNLRYLDVGRIYNMKVAAMPLDWSKLGEMPLVGLSLYQAQVDDLSFLTKMTSLRFLVLPKSVEDLGLLKDCEFDLLVAPGVKDLRGQVEKYNITIKMREYYQLPLNEENYDFLYGAMLADMRY